MSKNQKQSTKNNSLFVMERRNYQILFVGLAFLVLGFILMSGVANGTSFMCAYHWLDVWLPNHNNSERSELK